MPKTGCGILQPTSLKTAHMAHRTLRLTEEDERNIARVQEHFRNGDIPIDIHWNEVIRTGLRELAQRISTETEPASRTTATAN